MGYALILFFFVLCYHVLGLKKMEKPIYSEIYDFENLYQAAHETIRDKRYYPKELRFSNNLEENLIELQNMLIWHSYVPGNYYKFWVYDPKKRLICAPELKDRVIQTALCRVIERYINPRLDYDSYACIPEKGTLAAANRAALFANKYTYFLYLDIEHFFDNVPIFPLEEVYRKRFIDDSEIMWLLHTIFMNDCNGIGIKKGCRTSQLSANVYLNEIDHFIRHGLNVKAFVRYMDDSLIFSNSEEFLRECREKLSRFTKENYFLKYNNKSCIGKTSHGINFLGFKILPKYKVVRKNTLNRSAENFKAWQKGKIDDISFYRSTASRIGHCEGTSSYKWYCDYLLKALKFVLIDKDKVYN